MELPLAKGIEESLLKLEVVQAREATVAQE
jgi:hypothetical protein